MPDTRARGLDLSANQDPAAMRYGDWRITPGLSFGWYRASIGSITDRHQAAHGAGLRGTDYLTGCYHALHEAVAPAAQAQLFLSLQHAGNRLPPALDVERAALTRQHVLDFLRAWARLGGPRLTLYSSRQRWLGIMGAEPLPDDVRAAFALLWIAAYPFDSADPQPMDADSVALRSTPPLTRTPPLLPDPLEWWEIWQHTGHGTLPGYGGFVDLNVYNGTEQDLRARFAGTTAMQYLITTPDTTTIAQLRAALGPLLVAGAAVIPFAEPPVAPPPPDPVPLYSVRIKVAVLNVRGGVGTTFPVVNTLPLGTVAGVYEERGGWGRVAPLVEQWINVGANYVERLTPLV